MAQIQVGLRLEKATLARVDSARGGVPRNRWIREALEAALDDGGSPVTGTADIGGPAVAAPPSPASPRASDVDRLREEVKRFEPELRALAETAPVARSSGPFACPEPLCLKKGQKGEPCPVHEVPMTFKL